MNQSINRSVNKFRRGIFQTFAVLIVGVGAALSLIFDLAENISDKTFSSGTECTFCTLSSSLELGVVSPNSAPPAPELHDFVAYTFSEVLPKSFLWLKSSQPPVGPG